MTDKEIAAAGKAEGWFLATVINNGERRPYLEVFGVGRPDLEARAFVVDRAKANSALHIHVLRAVMHSRMSTTTARKKR